MKAKETITAYQARTRKRNAEMLAYFAEWLAQGYNYTEAATKTGAKFRVTPETVRRVRCAAGECSRELSLSIIRDAARKRREEARERRERGETLPEIAAALGVNPTTIYKDLKKYKEEHRDERDTATT